VAWNYKYKKEMDNIRTYNFDTHPQTVDKAPTLNSSKASRDAYLAWARAEYAKLRGDEKAKIKAELLKVKTDLEINRKKTSLLKKIARRCSAQIAQNSGSKTVDELTTILKDCDEAKRKDNFEKSEVIRKAAIKLSEEEKAKKGAAKEAEQKKKDAVIQQATESGISLTREGATAAELLDEIAQNKKYPEISKRVYEYFNKNNPATGKYVAKFFTTIAKRKQKLEAHAASEGVTVEKMLEMWAGDFVGKMVNDYIKQYLERDPNGADPPYRYSIDKMAVLASDVHLPYTEKLRKLLIKARRFEKRNLPIRYLGMKLADNKFLKPPKARIGGRAQIAKDDAKLAAALKAEKAKTDSLKLTKGYEAKAANAALQAADLAAGSVEAGSPEAIKAAEFDKYATENQKTYKFRNFIQDALKSGDRNRYSLDNPKGQNRDYAIDSILANLAYTPIGQMPKVVFGEWKFLGGDSTSETKVFINSSSQKIKMAFKGTDTISELLGVDLFTIALGATQAIGADFHWQRAIKVYKSLKGKYPSAEFSFTGHSLGARTAIVVADYNQAQHPGNKIHVSGFATGSGLPAFFENTRLGIEKFLKTNTSLDWIKPVVQLYEVSGDPLSVSERGRRHKTRLYRIKQQVFKCESSMMAPHAMLNYIHKDFWTIKQLKECGSKRGGLGQKRNAGGRGLEEGSAAAKAAAKAAAEAKAAQKKSDGEVWYDKPDV
jgi:hypothetical protein